jgi:hypothetical protein
LYEIPSIHLPTRGDELVLRMEIKTITKYTFLINFLIAIFFGFFMLVIPEIYFDLTGWPQELYLSRVVGPFFVAVAFATLLAFRESEWGRVEIIVYMCLILNFLALVGSIWGMLIMTLPIIGWAYTGIWALLLLLYIYVYYVQKMQ